MAKQWGSLTLKEVEVLRSLLDRFVRVCPDEGGKIDPADQRLIKKAEGILKP